MCIHFSGRSIPSVNRPVLDANGAVEVSNKVWSGQPPSGIVNNLQIPHSLGAQFTIRHRELIHEIDIDSSFYVFSSWHKEQDQCFAAPFSGFQACKVILVFSPYLTLLC